VKQTKLLLRKQKVKKTPSREFWPQVSKSAHLHNGRLVDLKPLQYKASATKLDQFRRLNEASISLESRRGPRPVKYRHVAKAILKISKHDNNAKNLNFFYRKKSNRLAILTKSYFLFGHSRVFPTKLFIRCVNLEIEKCKHYSKHKATINKYRSEFFGLQYNPIPKPLLKASNRAFSALRVRLTKVYCRSDAEIFSANVSQLNFDNYDERMHLIIPLFEGGGGSDQKIGNNGHLKQNKVRSVWMYSSGYSIVLR